MVDEPQKKILLTQAIPNLTVVAGSELEALDLKPYIQSPEELPLSFSAILQDEQPLPKDIICSHDGVLSGIAAKHTEQEMPYTIMVTVSAEGIEPLTFPVQLTIFEGAAEEDVTEESVGTPETEADEAAVSVSEVDTESDDEFEEDEVAEEKEIEAPLSEEEVKELKGYENLRKYWETFAEGLQLPDLEAVLTREVSAQDIYYLLSRFATLVIWNADDLRPANVGKNLQLESVNNRFNFYDFGVALVATPTKLFDSERTLKDALEAARSMVKEVQRRKWNIELAGFDKMVTAAWVEVHRLNQISQEHQIEIYNFEPTEADYNVLFKAIKPSNNKAPRGA